ncbi:C40 family peptidase [Pseudonocardia kunmingensis]|uniref:NlpC/P60 family protein n=1 Tax=Pseudonocardia kunmingensis TaxID=630975 RepID=A0A543CXA4_9PSEU|nr:C40 family peptidase [Pseudonocardia kunmingensis]TQM01669.1 NlpC/P60 family protein [Pseudonocardia kunmingensis]
MRGPAAGAVVGAIALVLLLFLVILTGGSLGTLQPPAGGCAITAQPGTRPADAAPGAPASQQGATLNADQMTIAGTVVAVGKSMGITERGTAIAVATAMQESSLNPAAVSGRSVGIFQQQGDYYAHVDKTDPAAAAAAFYQMLLQRVPNYDNPDPTTGGIGLADAAQRVQASGAGASWYARWEQWAMTLAGQLYRGTPGVAPGDPAGAGVVCAAGGGPGPVTVALNGLTVQLPPEAGLAATFTFPDPAAATAAAAALTYLGTPYVWGGGGVNGPSQGTHTGATDRAAAVVAAGTSGFDCSGLTQYAYAQAGITLPRVSQQQAAHGHTAPWAQAQPGDLLFWGNPVHHVAIYLGVVDGAHYMVEAPSTGSTVRVSPVRAGGDFTHTVVRPSAGLAPKGPR